MKSGNRYYDEVLRLVASGDLTIADDDESKPTVTQSKLNSTPMRRSA